MDDQRSGAQNSVNNNLVTGCISMPSIIWFGYSRQLFCDEVQRQQRVTP